MTAQELGKLIDESVNIRAMLRVIRACEGTDTANGYKYLFGYTPHAEKLFKSFVAHPNKPVTYTDLKGKKIKTTAAGAYQIIYGTWMEVKKRLGLVDFGPRSQDICALYLIWEKGAIPLIVKGDLKGALNKVRNIWASVPMATANQPTKSYEFALHSYQSAGGTLAA